MVFKPGQSGKTEDPPQLLGIPYSPRQAFLPYHANTKRFAVTLAHRRAGKTVARINQLLRAACKCTKRAPRYAYIDPYLAQAKRTAWDYLQYYSRPLLQKGGKANQSELYVELPHNDAQIRLYGAENADSMRGSYFDGVVIDEAQHIQRSVLSTIIMPALSDRKGFLDVSGTAKGWENLLGELITLARDNPDQWFLQVLKASETHILPEEELAIARRVMSKNEYAQEFECDLEAAITGAVYGEQMATAHIGKVELIPDLAVHTAWDLGFDDATAIWWFQVLTGEIHLIDYWEGSHVEVPGLVKVVKDRGNERGFKYGDHFVPHDATHKLLAAGGRSIVQQMFVLGVKTRVVSATSQQNSIEAARVTLGRCWFDQEHCKDGIGALRQYQFELDEDKKIYRSKPRHDWSSHGADAFEIIGQVWKEPKARIEEIKPRFLNDATADEVFWPPKFWKKSQRI